MADRVGQQLGNYRLIRLLGRGGFAEVYLGEHLHLGTQAAVKVLYTRLASKDGVKGFEKEARTVAHLKHPHIVRILDYDVEEDTPFLVMDYAPGGTLRKRHPKGTILPLTTIISYVKQIAGALQCAHDQRVIHRDVKPENMLVGEHDELLLSDFGIAIVAQSSLYQSTQNIGGTVAYIAPEQIQGHPSPASDQYSLGMVVYEWISGDYPFHGSMTEIMAQHLAVSPPPLCEKVPTISPDIEKVVLTALEKDLHKRFANVQTFAMALALAYQTALTHPVALPSEFTRQNQPLPLTNAGAAISLNQTSQPTDLVTSPRQALLPANVVISPGQSLQPPIAVTPSSTPGVSPPLMGESVPAHEPLSSQRPISRRAVVAGLAGLAVAGMVGGGLFWLARSQQPAAPTLSIGTTLYTYRGHANIVDTLAWSPDGKHIASGSVDKTVQVWDAADGGHVFTYRGHADIVDAVAWSPDGKHIASESVDKTVQVWDAADGGHVFTYRGHANIVDTLAWSPDGKRIASGGWDATVQVWDAADGGHVFTYRGHADTVYTLAWSPDGKRIASGSLDKTVQVWDAVDGGHVFTYRGHADTVYTLAWSPDGKRIASAGYDKTVQVWDAADGGHVFTYRGHANIVDTLAWSPDGKRIASGGWDATVQVWDVADGGHVFTYREHSDWVQAVAWSPDGTRIASGSNDSTVQVWRAV